jgi:hypothetical protein
MVGLAFAVLNVATVEAQLMPNHPCYNIAPADRDGHACWPAGEDPSVSVESSGEGGDGGAGALENAAIPGGNPVDAEIVDRLGGGNAEEAAAVDAQVKIRNAAALKRFSLKKSSNASLKETTPWNSAQRTGRIVKGAVARNEMLIGW